MYCLVCVRLWLGDRICLKLSWISTAWRTRWDVLTIAPIVNRIRITWSSVYHSEFAEKPHEFKEMAKIVNKAKDTLRYEQEKREFIDGLRCFHYNRGYVNCIVYVIIKALFSESWLYVQVLSLFHHVFNCLHFRTPFHLTPRYGNKEVDLYWLYQKVTGLGGWKRVCCLSMSHFSSYHKIIRSVILYIRQSRCICLTVLIYAWPWHCYWM